MGREGRKGYLPVNKSLKTGDFLLVCIKRCLSVTYAFIPLNDPLYDNVNEWNIRFNTGREEREGE